MALVVIAAAIFVGLRQRSSWIILPMSMAFTIFYVAGKWDIWKQFHAHNGLAKTCANLLVTLPIQLVVCGLIYLVGYGLGSLLGGRPSATGLEPFDWYFVAGLCAVMIPASVLTTSIERNARMQDLEAELHEPEIDIDVAIELTVDTFFQGVHFTHHEHERTNPDLIPDASITKPRQIEATEKRLGIKLPSLLRQLYKKQNGGSTGECFLPAKDNPGPFYADWRMPFSSDYNELKPLEDLQTFYDHFLEWGDPDNEDDTANLPENAKQMIVLSLRYADTTYLDYSKPGEPTVGVADFDAYSEEQNLYFESFEHFFNELRRER